MSKLSIRGDLVEAHDRAWAAIAAPGTWLTGERRVAVAAEIRRARTCAQCTRLKAALSPNIPGAHETTGRLGVAEVELIHRVVGDPGRLSEKWSQEVLARGLSEGEYVEIVGLTAMVMMMDTFTRAIGAPERPLPAPVAGEPTRYRPSGARIGRSPTAITCRASTSIASTLPFAPSRGRRWRSSPRGCQQCTCAHIERRHTPTCSVRACKPRAGRSICAA
jgi:hypothetical protein